MREGPLKPVQKGSSRHLSRAFANSLLNVCNNVMTAETKGPIKFTYTDGKLLIEVDAEAIEGGGAINFEGEWVDQAYSENDVVIRSNAAAIDDGTVAGTYIALSDVPQGTIPPGEAGSEAFWALFAKGFWEKLLIGSTDEAFTTIENGEVHAPVSIIAGELDGPRVELTKEQLESLGLPEANKVFRAEIKTFCEGGVNWKAGFICTEKWLA